VESEYDGPKFDEKITKEFIEKMTEFFKSRKKIHKKYAYKVSNFCVYVEYIISYSVFVFNVMFLCSYYQIVLAASQIISEAPSLIDVTIPKDSNLTVCGNIHGMLINDL
jgi:serine/threonine-protein phosphatase 5